MEVVAEGIETTEQLSLLKKMDFEFGQGYYDGKVLGDEPLAIGLILGSLVGGFIVAMVFEIKKKW